MKDVERWGLVYCKPLDQIAEYLSMLVVSRGCSVKIIFQKNIASLINQMVFNKVVNLMQKKQIDSVISSGLIVKHKHTLYI